MKPGVATRIAAAGALGRVLREQAYSNVVVRHSGLPPREEAALQSLVFGTLRRLVRVDRVLGGAANRPIDEMAPEVCDLVRIGLYELLFTPAPDHAVVDSIVEGVRVTSGERPVGFANAVLRRVLREGEPALPEGDPGAALRLGVPDWLWRRLADTFGPDDAAAFVAASNQPAPIGVWARVGLPATVDGEAVDEIDGAYYLADAGGLAAAVEGGEVLVTDPASRAAVLAVGAVPGERVVDLAAAPGGKTAQLWDAVQPDGSVTGVDRHQRRLGSARTRLAAAGIHPEWVLADARRPPAELAGADAVLVDAPCTGLGTLRRRPEIRHRIRPDSPAELASVQRAMLEAGLALLRPGGRLVYSVCTVFPEETVDVVAAFPAAPPSGLPGRVWGKGLLLAPHLTATDGMFISVIG